MQLVQRFQTSQLWKLLLPLALASDTLGLYDVVPEPVQKIMSIPAFNLLLLTMFVVEAGADLTVATGFFLLLSFFYVQKNGLQALFKPREKEAFVQY